MSSIRIVEVKPDNSKKAGTNVIEDYGQKWISQWYRLYVNSNV